MALTNTGRVLAWGANGGGQTDVPSAAQAGSVVAIAAGGGHSMALTSTGRVLAWGYNGVGQTDVPSAAQAGSLAAIAAGGYHSMALTNTGRVLAWGDNGYGQTDVPSAALAGSVVAIAAGGWYLGEGHSMALLSTGGLTLAMQHAEWPVMKLCHYQPQHATACHLHSCPMLFAGSVAQGGF